MEQRLIQSPQMIQAMQILQLSSLDLQDRIAAELLENPFLEVEERTPTEESTEREADPLENMIEVLERYEKDFGDGRSRSGGSEDGDRKQEAMQNTPATYHSLGDALIDESALIDLDDRGRRLIEFVAFSLDERGYLKESLEELAESCEEPGVDAEDLQQVLLILRHATHPALGARDLKECLLLQLDRPEIDAPLARLLVENHLEDIITNRLPRIARETNSTLEEVKEAIDVIRSLDPIPGREYGGRPAETIHPDVVVEEVDGTFEVRLTREGVPRLALNSTYREMLRQARKGDSVRKWIQQRLENARWFIDALEQRQSTLLRISEALFARQQAFLEKGVKDLAPLRMSEIADTIGVHISTVSRAVAGKYAQTPHGIFSLRSFFSGGTKKDSGGEASQASIQQRVKELIEKEDPAHPLSDDRLADLLKERDGIKIARRTITKYRKALGLPSSTQRRRF